MHIKGNVKWGIIGCGDVAEIKSGPAFQKVAHSELVAVMRRNGDKAADFAKRHHVPKWYNDAEKLINDPDINAIYVATPPSTHAAYAIKSMQAGKPVYVEKPMAMNVDECQQMIDVSQQTGVPIFVAYYRRVMPYFMKLKSLVDMQAIGDIKMINIKLHLPATDEELSGTPDWHVDAQISGGGHFHDLACHQLDLLEYVFGPIVTTNGMASNQTNLYPADDIVSAVFQFESGIAGTGSWCFSVPKNQSIDSTEIIGSKGKITFSFFDSTIISLDSENNTEDFDIPKPTHVHQPLVDLVVKELRGEGYCPSTGKTGMRATLLMDQIVSN